MNEWHKFPNERPPMDKPLAVLCAEFGCPLMPVFVMAFQSSLAKGNENIQFMMHGVHNEDGNNNPHYLADQVHYWIELPIFPKEVKNG